MKSPSALAANLPQSPASPPPAPSSGAGGPEAEGLDGSGGGSRGLREKVYKGAAWVTLASVLTQGLNLVRLVALTHLLTLHDFGMAGLLLTIISGLGLLTNLGMGGVVITRRFEDEAELRRYMDTAWSFEIARNAAFSLLLCALAFPIARWMRQPELGPLLLASAPTPLLHSFHNVGLNLYRRDVNLARITQFDLTCGVATVVLTIAFAAVMRSAWAIVVSNIVFSAFLVALSYKFHPYRPRPTFDREAFRVGFRFGQSVFIGGLMAYVGANADNVIVGQQKGTVVLAFYMAAFGVAMLPQKVVQGLLGTVLFPSFAAAGRAGGEQVERIVSRAFVLGCSMMALLILPLFVLAPEVLSIFGKSEYIRAAPVLQVMLAGALFRALTQILSPLSHGLGRPEIDAKASTVEAVVFVSLLLTLTPRYEAIGAAWAGVASYALSCVLRWAWCRPLAPRAFASLPQTLGLSVLCAGGGWGAGVWVLSLPFLAHSNPWERAIVGGAVSMSVAIVVLAIVFPSLGDEWSKVAAMIRRKAGG